MASAGLLTFPLSARSAEQLERARLQLADFLEAQADVDLEDVATTLALGRERFTCRCAVVGDHREDVVAALRGHHAPTAAAIVGRAPDAVPRVAFAFGADAAGAAAVAAALPEVRRNVERAGGPAVSAVGVGFGLASQLTAAGVAPAAVCGDGVGVLAAAAFAGSLELADAIRVAAALDRLVDERSALATAVVDVAGGAEALAERGGIAVVAVLGPERVVVAGTPADFAAAALSPTRVVSRSPALPRRLRPDDAERLVEALAAVAVERPQVPVAGAPADGDLRAWLLDQLVGCSTTWDGLTAAAGAAELVIELSSRPALVALAQRLVGPPRALCALGGGREPEFAWRLTLAELWCRGVETDFGATGRRIRLPLYPFRRPTDAAGPAVPPPPARAALAAAWTSMFGSAPDASTSFREAGGDSLRLVELWDAVRRIDPNVAPFEEFGAADTFGELAAVVDAAPERAATAAAGAEPEGRPLTPHQQRTLFLDLVRSGRSALLPENTVVATSELSAPADAAALEAAFAQLQREHDVLRMLVSWNGTCWVSRTAAEPALPFTVPTFEGDDAAAFEQALEALGHEAFDPVERPLGRGVLLQQGSRAAVALVLHRALTMPLSTEALLERLLELYVREHVAAPAR